MIALSTDGQDTSWTASKVAGRDAVSGIKVGLEREGEAAASGRRRLVAARQANVEKRSGSVHKKSFLQPGMD